MTLEPSRVSRWLEPLARQPGEIADVLIERREESVLELEDGEVVSTRSAGTEALAARWQRGNRQILSSVSRADEAGLRETLRELQAALGKPSLPVRAEKADPPPAAADGAPAARWGRRLLALLERHAPRHRLRCTLAEVSRDVVPAQGPAAAHARRLLSITGELTAASRRGDERRTFSFHGPDSEALAEEVRGALARAAEPREAAIPCPEGEADAVLARGCAVVLFHEILSHPLEAGVRSPLSALADARVAIGELDVKDDATRLDLFGGYEADDEGVRPRPVRLLDAGRLGGRLTTRALAARMGREPSNGHGRRAEAGDAPLPRGSNLIVASGGATREDLARRLGQGIWIEDFEGGSVDLESATFRLRFPRARRVRRGRLTEELGPGILAGEILTALKNVESGLGRELHAYRPLGWCARAGQVVAVQGSAPDVLVRRIAVRAAP